MRRIDIAGLVAALGAALLFISLFMHWYQPALTAWRVFEVWDLVLAALALAALWLALGSAFSEAPLSERALGLVGGAAFVIVVSQIVSHPPAAHSHKPGGGAWLALFGSALMAAGGALRAADFSLSLTVSAPARDRERGAPAAAPSRPRGYRMSPENEAAEVEPEVQHELYPEGERHGPIGADDPEPWSPGPEDETLPFSAESEERS